MVLGILSDTHGFFHPALPSVFASVDAILHAGDIGPLSVLDQLEKLAPVHAVWGNIDGADIRREVPAYQHLTFTGISIVMTHIGGHPKRWAKGIPDLLRTHQPDLFICGHSHILRIERTDRPHPLLYLNPGAAGRQGFHQVKTCVRLHLAEGQLQQAEVIHLDEETPTPFPS